LIGVLLGFILTGIPGRGLLEVETRLNVRKELRRRNSIDTSPDPSIGDESGRRYEQDEGLQNRGQLVCA